MVNLSILNRMSEAILKLEDAIPVKTDVIENKSEKKNKKKSKDVNLLRGVPKSGRTWKTPKKRFSSIIKTRGYKKANKFERLQALKQNLTRIRDLSRSIVEKKQQEIKKKKERRRINLKQKEEKRLKSEVVQVIKNTAKIKRMKKKQLRSIQKQDTLNSC